MVDKELGDKIPEFGGSDAADQSVGVANMSALAAGTGRRTTGEIIAIILVAVIIIGGAELWIWLADVPQYVLPTPSSVIVALFTDFRFIGPHLSFALLD